MVAFRSPLDIWNRAVQHCGGNGIASLTEISRNAKAVSFAYDKQRESMLQMRTWTFATRRTVLRAIDSSTMRLLPALWSQTTTYFVGSIVTDQSESMWISNIPNNLNNDPLLSNFWEPYFGPRSVSLYVATTAYYAGELVYTTAGDGKNRTYLSLQSGNSDVPGTATPWDATTTFFKNQTVTYLSVAYQSLIDLNTNNIPASAPLLWSAATTYAIGNTVGGSDGIIYTSTTNGNAGNDPTLDGGVHWSSAGVFNPWTRVFIGGTGSDKWLQIGGAEFPMGVALTTLNLVYPYGAGPSSQPVSRNAFLKPAGYLRLAPQNPKHGVARLGGPSGVIFDDWLMEGEFIVSGFVGVITLRFVADITDVSKMETLFCEGLAAAIAFACSDVITQDKGQTQIVAKTYDEWKRLASTFDGIEDGFVDLPDDDWVTVRA